MITFVKFQIFKNTMYFLVLNESASSLINKGEGHQGII